MTSTLTIRSCAVCALLVAGPTGAAWAQSDSPAQALLSDSFVFNLGAFIMSTDLTARLDGQSRTNPEVDFDKTFGRPKDATRVRADALWRITPTQHLRFMYFDNSRTTSRALDQSIQWGDYNFQVGGNVELQTKFRIAELAYEYAFARQRDYEVAATFGVHYTKLSVSLSGAATLTDANGNVTQVPAATTSNSVPAPLPVIGLRGAWAVAPNWVLDAQGQYFKVSSDGTHGSVSDLRAGVTWMATQNFGVGLGYNRFGTNVDVNRSSFNGRVRTGYSGVQLYLTGAF